MDCPFSWGRRLLSLLKKQLLAPLPQRPYMWFPLSLTPEFQPAAGKTLTSPMLGRQRGHKAQRLPMEITLGEAKERTGVPVTERHSHCMHISLHTCLWVHVCHMCRCVQEMSVHLHAGKCIGAQGCVLCKGARVMQKMCRQVCIQVCVQTSCKAVLICANAPLWQSWGERGGKGERRAEAPPPSHPCSQ